MARYVINGKFLSQRTTGVQRYAGEIVRELDGMVGPGECTMAVPQGADASRIPLGNIAVAPCGRRHGVVWEQLDLPKFAKEQGALVVNLCNAAPMACPGIVCIHDAFVRTMPEVFSRKFVAWYRLLLRRYERKGMSFLTVSRFSAYELGRFYPGIAGKLAVVPNAWQHMNRVASDGAVFERFPALADGGYYLSIGSAAASKNFEWVVKAADANPECLFAIAGGGAKGVLRELDMRPRANVLRLGYVQDGELKALMERCRAFVSPSLYEGFGLPPLEALACGARIVVSDIPVYREVYENSAVYIDPRRADVNLEDLLASTRIEPANAVLVKYSWRASAGKLYEVMRACDKESESR